MVDLAAIDEGTRIMVSRGVKIAQAFRFADNDEDHVERLAKWADLPPFASVVDMGSGTGEVARLWQAKRTDLHFCLVNLSQYQIDIVPHLFRWHCCDMLNVPEADNFFDAAICCFAIGHTDKERAFKEMSRLVRPGGVVFVYDMIRLSGDNERMADLSYTVGSREDMESAASSAGLDLDFYMEPTPQPGWGEDALGVDYGTYFSDVAPAIWRFVVK